MKKSVILTILVIYIFAILTVGFIGIAQKVYDEKINVTGIECLNEYVAVENADYDIEIQLPKGETTVILSCRAVPANATVPVLDYYSDNENVEVVKNDDGTCTVTLVGKVRSAIVIVKSTDRTPGVQLRIKIKQTISGDDIL